MEIKTLFSFGDIVKLSSTAVDKIEQEMIGEIIQVIVRPRYNVVYEIKLNDGNTVYAKDPYYYDYSYEIDDGNDLKIIAHYIPANGCYSDTTMYADDGIIKEEIITNEGGSPALPGGRLR